MQSANVTVKPALTEMLEKLRIVAFTVREYAVRVGSEREFESSVTVYVG